MTDASGSQMVKFFGMDMPKLGVLSGNNIRDIEHYGNLVTHMRLKTLFHRPANNPPHRRKNNLFQVFPTAAFRLWALLCPAFTYAGIRDPANEVAPDDC